jgi:hypothetical protein
MFASMPPTTPLTTPGIWTFNAIANTFYDATPGSGLPWVMENKAYDPGPGPILTEEQKLAKEAKKKERQERKETSRAARVVANTELGNTVISTPGTNNQQGSSRAADSQRRHGQNGYNRPQPIAVQTQGATIDQIPGLVHFRGVSFADSDCQSAQAASSIALIFNPVGQVQPQQ